MNSDWRSFGKILCVRPDNMGDVLMAEPAMRAIKESFSSVKLTLLTSSYGSGIAEFMPEVNDVIVADLPWIKTETEHEDAGKLESLIKRLKDECFDGAVIFSNYSQSAAQTATICFLAGIRRRLAYSRENLYQLLTDWVPDTEPFTEIVHGVERNLNLVAKVGANPKSKKIDLHIPQKTKIDTYKKLKNLGVNPDNRIIVFHPGVRDDKKRQYPLQRFAEAAIALRKVGRIVVTGTKNEYEIAQKICDFVGDGSYNLSGLLSLGELVSLLDLSYLLIASNTGVVHIASAVGTPVVVLYARTNLEHTPWMTEARVLFYDVEPSFQSRTPILYYTTPNKSIGLPEASEIVEAANRLLKHKEEKKFERRTLWT